MITDYPTLQSVKRAGKLYDLHENKGMTYKRISESIGLSQRSVIRLVTMYKKYLRGDLD